MPQVPFSEITQLDTFKELPYEEQVKVTKNYWQKSAAEDVQEPPQTPQLKLDEQAQSAQVPSYHDEQYRDSLKLLDAKERLRTAPSVQARLLEQDVADSATAIAVRDSVKNGDMTFEEGVSFAKQKSEERAAQTETLKKTASLFTPEVQQAMQPAWAALEKSASNGQYFDTQDVTTKLYNAGADLLPGGQSYEKTAKSRAFYEESRNKLAADFNLEPAEVDDVVKHRMGKYEDNVSRDAMGQVYIKDDLLAKGNADDLLKAINAANLSPGTKKQALVEAPIKIGMFKENIVSAVKQNYPELAADIKFTGKLDEDYSSITKMLNDSGLEQAGSGAGSYLSKRVSQGEHVLGLFVD